MKLNSILFHFTCTFFLGMIILFGEASGIPDSPVGLIDVKYQFIRAFYNSTTVIIKYVCKSEGERELDMVAQSISCNPLKQTVNEESMWDNCTAGNVELVIPFKTMCHINKETVITTENTFQVCKNGRENNEATKVDEVASNTTTTNKKKNKRSNDDDDTKKDIKSAEKNMSHMAETPKHTFQTVAEKVYRIWFEFKNSKNFSDEIYLDFRYYGYLSPIEWPLLLFFQLSLAMYTFYMLSWLLLCCWYRKDLLQIQYYIAFVILLGWLEKVIFVAEYEFRNRTGQTNTYGTIFFGKMISSLKDSAARVLIIIAASGFGIVKPRLGKTLYYVLVLGAVYFVVSFVQSMAEYNQVSNVKIEVMAILLAALNTGICYWILTSLVNTKRTLRLRRNPVKLSLYKHFTYVLVFAMLISLLIMLWTFILRRSTSCIQNWQFIWVHEAMSPFIFMFILFCVIILWRPSASNQRYAYSPLTDEADDEDMEEQMVNGAFDGVKQRNKKEVTKKEDPMDDPLKWVEDNIPKSLDSAIPMIDSEEEVETTLFEINKMH